jgi:hypothetical protein
MSVKYANVIHIRKNHTGSERSKGNKAMKLYQKAKNNIVCDLHASDELKEILVPLSTLQVWDLIQKRQEHFSKFCVECNKVNA